MQPEQVVACPLERRGRSCAVVCLIAWVEWIRNGSIIVRKGMGNSGCRV